MQIKDKAINAAINDKLKVLKDFYIVNAENKEDVRNHFIEAILNEPDKNPLVVIDKVANRMIFTKLDKPRWEFVGTK